ncbi:MAG: ABC transporter permease [Saprospiraceae bacterium]|nr:ABC transporter permease [Saprospiraceae bacterium]
MNKFWLIVQREYLTRVRKKSFLITTLLAPLAILAFIVIVGFIMSYDEGGDIQIAVLDEGGLLEDRSLSDSKGMYFKTLNDDLPTLREKVKEGLYDGILYIPAVKNLDANRYTIYYYRDKSLGLDKRGSIQAKVKRIIRDYKVQELRMDERQLDALEVNIDFQPEPIDEDGEKESSMAAIVSAGIGGALAFVMYLVVLIYGMMVMRSVSEEKVSRIVEVMISSVKPVQLMLGKIIGVGAVGLTQAVIWAILLPIVSFVAGLFVEPPPQPDMDITSSGVDIQDLQFSFAQVMETIGAQNWWLIVPLFFFFFIGGYFLYASLFAAIGSAMGEDANESQALTFPVTIPIIIAFYIVFVAIRNPDANLVVWASIFPLFSPIVMPARLAMGPPWWQIALSVVFLIAGAAFFVWLSARIYRVGILMYGKKVTLKELGKWIFYKS